MITFVCILSSFVVLFSSEIIGTSNKLNIDENYIIVSDDRYYSRSALRRRGYSGGGESTATAMQSSAHRSMQQTSQNCIKISIFLDEYPEDTSWIITEESTGNILVSSPTYDGSMAMTQQVETTCLAAPAEYSFTISDDYEDGICCLWGVGNYTVTTLLPSTADVDGGGSSNVEEILASGGAWNGPNETTKFTLSQAPPTNMPTLQPTNNALPLVTLRPTENPSRSPISQPTSNPSLSSSLSPSAIPSLSQSVTPSSSPTMDIELVEQINVTSQVNIYLTGVPPNQNMTTAEQDVFETLFYTVLQSRLETVDVNVLKVVVDTQINDSQFDADSPFDSESDNDGIGGGGGGEDESVLQLLTNITFIYSDPPPEGWRDWSIYLTSWIESFGTTMVDIFTNEKHDLYPNEAFFNSISDVSATNVVPPNTDPTLSPTSSPTYLAAPAYKKPLVTGLASAGVIAVVLFFAGALWWKRRRLKMARTHDSSRSKIPEEHRKKDDDEEVIDIEEEEELDSLYDGLQDAIQLVPSSPSSVPKRNNSDDDDDGDDGSADDNDDNDEGDGDEVGSEENNDMKASPMMLEGTPKPRQEPLVMAAVPNELQDDFAQYDGIVKAVVANDPNLTQVVLDNKRQIGKDDEGEALWQALTTNTHVKVLSMRNSNITDDQMAALALALNENTSIRSLSLQNNLFTSEGVEYLVVCLESNSTIKTIELEGNSIDPRILDELEGILQSRGDHADNVSNDVNKIESMLEKIRGKDPSLTRLNLHDMGIGPNDTDAIMEALAGNVYLREVDLSSNMIDDDGVSALALALADDKSIERLELANNRITSIGAEYLLCALETNNTIVHVDLAGNPIEAEVIAELDQVLKQRKLDGC